MWFLLFCCLFNSMMYLNASFQCTPNIPLAQAVSQPLYKQAICKELHK